MHTNNTNESMNSKIKRLTHYKSNLSWNEFIELLLKIENEYKEKLY